MKQVPLETGIGDSGELGQETSFGWDISARGGVRDVRYTLEELGLPADLDT